MEIFLVARSLPCVAELTFHLIPLVAFAHTAYESALDALMMAYA